MSASEVNVCQVCQGVITPVPPEAYTSVRGRLIVTNGYCRGRCDTGDPAGGAAGDAAAHPSAPDRVAQPDEATSGL
ncbi:hypothetical protein GCM10010404_01270 [Nonomuraea africana]|uniref:Uncharacterized protein n=1 Tax=Nonomuraea africana TaxID=46171 RepID=A0ABR9KC37_9ACTN|nr:hypothetical protein [Nonomuraea africana]MBE1559495.1 hypothetical protein [Nonomuraea africana]